MIALTPLNEELAQVLVALDVPRALELLKLGANPAPVDAFFLGEGQGGCVSVLLKAVQDREEQVGFALARQHQDGVEIQDLKAALRAENAPVRDAVMGLVKALFKADPQLLVDNRVRGHTPLQEAAGLGWGRLVSWLVSKGAEVSETNNYGRNAAHYAALWGHRDTLKRLHGLGVNLNAQDQDQQTPAHLAATHQHVELMQNLKHYGADFTLGNTKGKTPGQTLGMHDTKTAALWGAWEQRFDASKQALAGVDERPRRGPRP